MCRETCFEGEAWDVGSLVSTGGSQGFPPKTRQSEFTVRGPSNMPTSIEISLVVIRSLVPSTAASQCLKDMQNFSPSKCGVDGKTTANFVVWVSSACLYV